MSYEATKYSLFGKSLENPLRYLTAALTLGFLVVYRNTLHTNGIQKGNPIYVFRVVLFGLITAYLGHLGSTERQAKLIPVFVSLAAIFPHQLVESSITRKSHVLLGFYWSFEAIETLKYPIPILPKILLLLGQITLGVLEIVLLSRHRSFTSAFETASSVYSNISFSWLNPAIESIYKNGFVRLEDLPEDAISQKANYDTEFQKQLGAKPDFSKKALVTALAKAFYPLAARAVAFHFLFRASEFVKPYLLKNLIRFIDRRYVGAEPDTKPGLIIALELFISILAMTEFTTWSSSASTRFSNAVCTSLRSVIYRKTLKLSRLAREKYPQGKIHNLVYSDMAAIRKASSNLNSILATPFRLLSCLLLLRGLVGWSTVGGLIILTISIPLNTYVISCITVYMKKSRAVKDKRGQAVIDLFSSMKLIKLYAWEDFMVKKLFKIRNDQEIPAVTGIRTWNSIMNFISPFLTFLASFVILAWYSLVSKKALTSDIMFTAIHLLQMLPSLILNIPQHITFTQNARLALGKVSEFLQAEEIADIVLKDPSQPDIAVKVPGLSFSWTAPDNQEKTKQALHDIHLEVKKGEFISLVGTVGAGKSALLSAILGDLYVSAGKGPITVNGLVAYVSQTPWITNTTLRENILFGHEYNTEAFNKVVIACQLSVDIEKLTQKDLTLVGEKGLSLSGGQKARIALARAVYSGAEVLIIDDVLSAVDNHVGSSLVREVFSKKGILAGRTVLLATNNSTVLAHSDRVYLIEDGRLVEKASYKDVVEAPGRLQKLKAYFSTHSDIPPTDTGSNFRSFVFDSKLAEFTLDPLKTQLTKRSELPVEKTSKGGILREVYIGYAKACSVPFVVFLAVLSILTELFSVGTKLWLDLWSHKAPLGENKAVLYYVLGYALIGSSGELVKFARGWFIKTKIGLGSGKSLFENMTSGLVNSPMVFFDKTPLGRITARYTIDIDKIEGVLPVKILRFITNSLEAAVTAIVLVYSSPALFPVLAVAVIPYKYAQARYLASLREFGRFTSASSAPILSHYQETALGLDSIRAYKQEDRFTKILHANMNFELQADYLSYAAGRWLIARLQALVAVIVLLISVYFVLMSGVNGVTGGTVGFAMGYAFSITMTLKSLVSSSTGIDTDFIAVERCLEYSKIVTEELSTTLTSTSSDWSSNGSIVFENYSATYENDSEPVLKEVSLSIKAGEKVGVVGRTGAGKSSLLLALFRMIKPIGGSITIGGVNTQSLKLHDLRSHLGIIPQDSFLFQGSIRENLDPFGEHLDDQIWQALEDAKMKTAVEALDSGLESKVGTDGSNLSGGQKQLLCLARALLKSSSFLFMDEATASVDSQTDELIQEVLREKTRNKTVITIAHRTSTVLKYDKILALEDGRVVEFDTPEALLNNPHSLFHSLVKAGV